MTDFHRFGFAPETGLGPEFFERMSREQEERPVHNCRDCRDTGYVRGIGRNFGGLTYEAVSPCPTCGEGRSIARGIEMAAAAKRVKAAKQEDKLRKDREILLEYDRRIQAGEQVRFNHREPKPWRHGDGEEEPPF